MEPNKQTRQSGHSPVELSMTGVHVLIVGAVLASMLASLQAIVCRHSVTRRANARRRTRGFSMIELAVVVMLALIITAFSIPYVLNIKNSQGILSDARSISAALNLARMRAAADFSHGRVYMDLAGNTYHLEVWNKAGGCWQTDGDANACTIATSPVTTLATGDTFGFGTIATGPAAAGAASQAPLCTAGVGGPAPGASTAKTACVEFNSRGYPVNSANTIVANDAIYITNSSTLYSAIAISISGQPSTYRYTGSGWAQF